jgi:hypothetical protein
MRPIVSLLTALAVNLHLVLGCCAHHAHGEHAGPCPRHDHSQPAGDAASGHAHSCPHGHHDAGPPTSPPGPILPVHGDCHESHCAFMIGGVMTFSPQPAVLFVGFPPEPTAREAASLRGVTPRDRGDPFELAVRTHLLHQSFLN